MAIVNWWKHLSPLERGLALIASSGVFLCIIFAIGIGMIIADRKMSNIKTAALVEERATKCFHHWPTRACLTPTCISAASNILKNMNRYVRPCDDFYEFVCGNFLDKISIPDDKSHVDAFTLIEDELQNQLRRSIEQPLLPGEHKSIRLVKNLYKSCMDEKSIEDQDVEPLLTILENLGGWPVLKGGDWNESDFSWTESVYKFREAGLPTNYFIRLRIDVDLKNSSSLVINIDQPSFGLLYEFLVQQQNQEILTAYHQYMIDIAVLLGASEEVARKELTESLEFETTLANISLSAEKRRTITRLYNPTTINKLSNEYPSIPWKEYINRILAPKLTVEDDETVIVNVPEYIHNFENLMKATPRKTQANYLMWRAIAAMVSFLNREMREKQLEFETKMSGKVDRELRWKECVRIASDHLSIGVASLYIKTHFNEHAKSKAVGMVQFIKKEFLELLKTVKWMDESSRKSALDKAASISANIAYPDELLDDKILEIFYSDLELSGGSFLGSILNLTRFKTEYFIDQLKNPYHKVNWNLHGGAVKVNAYYSHSENSINIPAAILQGRFFENNRPQYMNFGGIGFIMGHEMTHGFDNSGRYFDKHGNLGSWWTPLTLNEYTKRSVCIVNQYGNYTVSEVGLSLNGMNTRDENIADNGGIKLAYLAYRRWISRYGLELRLPGLPYTPQQLFWISAASTWCSKYRPKNLKLMIIDDHYSPAKFRVLGSFSNMIEFARDFKCRRSSKMNPNRKCDIW